MIPKPQYSFYIILIFSFFSSCSKENEVYHNRFGIESEINIYLEREKKDKNDKFNINFFNFLDHKGFHILADCPNDTTNLKRFVLLSASSNEIAVYSNGKYYYYKAIDEAEKDVLYDFETTTFTPED